MYTTAGANQTNCPDSCYNEIIKPLYLSPEKVNSHGFIPLKTDIYATW